MGLGSTQFSRVVCVGPGSFLFERVLDKPIWLQNRRNGLRFVAERSTITCQQWLHNPSLPKSEFKPPKTNIQKIATKSRRTIRKTSTSTQPKLPNPQNPKLPKRQEQAHQAKTPNFRTLRVLFAVNPFQDLGPTKAQSRAEQPACRANSSSAPRCPSTKSLEWLRV